MVSTHQCFTVIREHLSMFCFFSPKIWLLQSGRIYSKRKGQKDKKKKKKVPEECKNKMYIPGYFQTVHRNHYHIWITTEI